MLLSTGVCARRPPPVRFCLKEHGAARRLLAGPGSWPLSQQRCSPPSQPASFKFEPRLGHWPSLSVLDDTNILAPCSGTGRALKKAICLRRQAFPGHGSPPAKTQNERILSESQSDPSAGRLCDCQEPSHVLRACTQS